MAERRMFSKKIVESDAFLDMPLSSQALYLHLNMEADDDGFVNSPKRIQRMIGASEDDLKLLLAKNFIIQFESGVVVVKHWKINNYIAKDRYHETVYLEEKALLYEKNNSAYTIDANSIQENEVVEIDESPAEPPVITIMLNDKSEYGVTQKAVDEFQELYPAVDVMQELRKMKGWSISNPTKRKTKRGINRFINSWLAKEQDRGGFVNPPDRKSQIDEWSRK